MSDDRWNFDADSPAWDRFSDDDLDSFELRTIDTDTFDVVDAPERRSKVPPFSSESTPPRRKAPIGAEGRARRRARQRQMPSRHVWIGTLVSILTVGGAAVLVATIFSFWTQPAFFSDEFRAGLNEVQATQQLINIIPSPIPTDTHSVRIGIVAGHSGPPQDETFQVDPGATCPDGLTELEINNAVAQMVVTGLLRENYNVDLLEEFDPRLSNYEADALISIHTNDCADYGAGGTGYNAAAASGRNTTRGQDERLMECLITQYGQTTGLPRHYGITDDMTFYHTFSEVSVNTPTAIIEIGYMRNDRAILTQQPDKVAQGIINGIRCFLREPGYDTLGQPSVPLEAGQ